MGSSSEESPKHLAPAAAWETVRNERDVPGWLRDYLKDHSARDLVAYATRGRQLLDDLDLFTPETVPSVRELPRLHTLLHEPWDAKGTCLRQFLRGAGDEPQRVLLVELLRDPHKAADIADYLMGLERISNCLLRRRVGLQGHAVTELLGTPSLTELCCLADRWKAVQSQLARRLKHALAGVAASDLAWPPLFAGFFHVEGFEFRCLHSVSAVEKEEAWRGECMDSWLCECLMGECHLLSLRRGGERVATLEARFDRVRDSRALVVSDTARAQGSAEVAEACRLLQANVRERRLELHPEIWRRRPEQAGWMQRMFGMLPPRQRLPQRPAPSYGLFLALWQQFGADIVECYRPALQLAPGRGGVYEAVLHLREKQHELDERIDPASMRLAHRLERLRWVAACRTLQSSR